MTSQDPYSVNHQINSFGIWLNVIRFYARNAATLFLILPLLIIPVFTDALHTLLVYQYSKHQNLRIGISIHQAFKATLPLLMVKARFWWRSILWGFIPVIGWVKDTQLRVAWGMASNVLLLEGQMHSTCTKRSEELAKHSASGLLLRTLVTVPSLLLFIGIVLYVVLDRFVEGSWLLMCWFGMSVWLILPASATANTLAYLSVAKQR